MLREMHIFFAVCKRSPPQRRRSAGAVTLFAPPEAPPEFWFPQPISPCGSLAKAQGPVCAFQGEETLTLPSSLSSCWDLLNCPAAMGILASSRDPRWRIWPWQRSDLGVVNDLSCLSNLSEMFGSSPGRRARTRAPRAQGQEHWLCAQLGPSWSHAPSLPGQSWTRGRSGGFAHCPGWWLVAAVPQMPA